MKIKSMNIKGHRYRFKILPLRESYGVLGKCDSSSKIIYIDDKLEGEDLTATILHEIGHAICYEVGLGQAISIEIEEIIVENFANEFTRHFKILPK